MRTARTRTGGFTLVEVTFATSFIVIAILSLFALLTSSMQAGAASQERAKALRVAQNVLEQLRTQTAVRSFSDGFAGVSSRTFDVKVADTFLKQQPGDPDGRVGFVWYPGDDSTKVSAEDARRLASGRPLLLPWPSDSNSLTGTRASSWTPTDLKSGRLGQLREDVLFAPLGLPRDLDASGAIDDAKTAGGADVSSRALLLPVVVVVEWRGVVGNSRLELASTLGNR